eukprot:SAG31_NODE_17015_length_686_cov_1.718910_1_plen_165_part_10
MDAPTRSRMLSLLLLATAAQLRGVPAQVPVLIETASTTMTVLSGLSAGTAFPWAGFDSAFELAAPSAAIVITAAEYRGGHGWYRVSMYLHVSATFDGTVGRLVHAEVVNAAASIGSRTSSSAYASPRDWRDQWQHIEMVVPANVARADPSQLLLRIDGGTHNWRG